MPNILNIKNEKLENIIQLDGNFCILCNANSIKASAIRTLASQLLFEHELDIVQQRKQLSAKKEYIASRFLIKTFISRHFEISYNTIQLSFNNNLNKLQAVVNNKPLPINISLAHSKGMVLFAISTEEALIGVDIEYQNLDRDIVALSEHFFHPNEFSAIAKGDYIKFYQLWTLKESIAKATGQSIYQLLGQETLQVLKGFHYTLAQHNGFQLAALQSGEFSSPSCYLLDLEKLLQSYDE